MAALSETGEAFTVTTGCGVVSLPNEAADVETALNLADERLYATKLSRHAGSDTVEALMRTLHAAEPEIETHVGHVGWLARAVARELGLSAEYTDEVTRAAKLHDIGKLAMPDAILHKPAPLSDSECEFIRAHSVIGERIVAAAPPLVPVARLIRSSHERWDGNGYPDGLAGDEIPLGARIILACDAFDAITSVRDYRASRDAHEAAAELRRQSGSQFDPAVVEALLKVLEGEGRLSATDEAPPAQAVTWPTEALVQQGA